MPRRTRKPPPPPAAQAAPDEHAARRAALVALDVEAMRAWAAQHIPDELNTIALADDASLLESMHEARMQDETMPPELRLASVLWLVPRGNRVAIAAARQLGLLKEKKT